MEINQESFQQLKQSFDGLRSGHNEVKPDLFKDRIVHAHKTWVLDKLGPIFSKEFNDHSAQEMRQFFEAHWDMVKGTLVSPTAIPEADVTLFLCQIAPLISQDKKPIQILCTDIEWETEMADYTPKEDHAFLEYPQLDEHIPLTDIIKTHIISDDCQTIIPVRYLAEERFINHTFQQRNQEAYSPYNSSYGTITPNEFQRLINHSKFTNELNNVVEQFHQLSTQKNQNLYSELVRLCAVLRIEDAHQGRGSAEQVGESAFTALQYFAEFYQKIEPTIKAKLEQPAVTEDEIKEKEKLAKIIASVDKLLNVSSDYKGNMVSRIETCAGTRREDIEKNMAGCESILTKLSLDESIVQQQINKALETRNQLRTDLTQVLDKSEYKGGFEPLGVTQQLVTTLDVPLEVRNENDLQFIKNLSAQEIDLLVEPNIELQKQIMAQFKTLESLILFTHGINIEKLDKLLTLLRPQIEDKFIRFPIDLSGLMITHPPEVVSLLNYHFSFKYEPDDTVLDQSQRDAIKASLNEPKMRILSLAAEEDLKDATEFKKLIDELPPDSKQKMLNRAWEIAFNNGNELIIGTLLTYPIDINKNIRHIKYTQDRAEESVESVEKGVLDSVLELHPLNLDLISRVLNHPNLNLSAPSNQNFLSNYILKITNAHATKREVFEIINVYLQKTERGTDNPKLKQLHDLSIADINSGTQDKSLFEIRNIGELITISRLLDVKKLDAYLNQVDDEKKSKQVATSRELTALLFGHHSPEKLQILNYYFRQKHAPLRKALDEKQNAALLGPDTDPKVEIIQLLTKPINYNTLNHTMVRFKQLMQDVPSEFRAKLLSRALDALTNTKQTLRQDQLSPLYKAILSHKELTVETIDNLYTKAYYAHNYQLETLLIADERLSAREDIAREMLSSGRSEELEAAIKYANPDSINSLNPESLKKIARTLLDNNLDEGFTSLAAKLNDHKRGFFLNQAALLFPESNCTNGVILHRLVDYSGNRYLANSDGQRGALEIAVASNDYISMNKLLDLKVKPLSESFFHRVSDVRDQHTLKRLIEQFPNQLDESDLLNRHYDKPEVAQVLFERGILLSSTFGTANAKRYDENIVIASCITGLESEAKTTEASEFLQKVKFNDIIKEVLQKQVKLCRNGTFSSYDKADVLANLAKDLFTARRELMNSASGNFKEVAVKFCGTCEEALEKSRPKLSEHQTTAGRLKHWFMDLVKTPLAWFGIHKQELTGSERKVVSAQKSFKSALEAMKPEAGVTKISAETIKERLDAMKANNDNQGDEPSVQNIV